MKIILASSSPRRIELLKRLNLNFKTIPAEIDENIDEKEPINHVLTLAELKAKEVFKKSEKGQVIIAADTIVYYKQIIGKPKDYNDAFKILKTLSGKWHSVYTGVFILFPNEAVSFYEKTDVKFKRLSNEIIEFYLSSGEAYDKAGAYAIQGLGSILVEKISGDFYNVMGLPISKLWDLLWSRGIINEAKRKTT
jgi:septum formation protein